MKGRTRPEGVVKSNHALGHSLSGSYEAPEGLGLFEQWGEEARSGGMEMERRDSTPVGEVEACRMFWTYWTTDLSQVQVAVRFSRDASTVRTVVNREGRFAKLCESVAFRLDYPDERDWTGGRTRKVEVG